MNNTSKRAGIVGAVLLGAGLVGACPATAFADSSPNQATVGNLAVRAAVTHYVGADRVHHDQRADNFRLILDRGPHWRGDNDRRGDHDRRGDNDWRGDNDRYGRAHHDVHPFSRVAGR
jgi:hypothetical protein